MLVGIDKVLKRLSSSISSTSRIVQSTDSPYQNINYYQNFTDPSETKEDTQNGPPAMTNEPGRSERGNPKELMQFQGERPLVDSLVGPSSLPVTTTVLNEGRTDAQGERVNKHYSPGALDDNRDTVEVGYGDWTEPSNDVAPSGWNNPNLYR
jgi:hypothetical protein